MDRVDVSPSLTTFRATGAQRWVAAAVTIGVVGISAAVLPIAKVPGAVVPAFLPAFITAVFLTDGITAFLLYRQAITGRAMSLAVLASAYLFSALIVVPHVLAFPAVFAPDGLFGAGPQTAVWLWAAWHLGWPAIVLASIAMLGREAAQRGPRPSSRAVTHRAIALALVTALIVTVVGVVTFRFQAALPAIVVHGDYRPLIRLGIGPAIVIAAFGALVASVLVLRLRSVAHLWLTVAIAACFCDVVLTLGGGSRYSVGWYVARFDSIVTASVVLGALLHEAGRLGGILADGERRLRAIVDGVADALLTVTPDGRVASANPAAEVLFGFDATVRALQIDDLVVDYAQRVKTFRGSTAIEAQGRHAGGRVFPIELVFGGETDAGRIVIARDITQRRRAEDAIREARDRALEAASAKSTFLATMSHEIRTPISAIVGMSELLLQASLDGDAREYATTVRDSAGALLAVINDILDFSKIEAGKLEIDAIPFSVLATVESASDIIAALARARGLSLSTYVAPDVPVASIGDPSRVRQVLLNLLGNAVKFTAEGSVVVRATVEATAGTRSVVRFEVSDTGVGIPEEALGKLFEPFRQVDSSTSRKYGGTGLGLSISRRLVELMGGAIGAVSTLGAGSTFWFTIPLKRVADELTLDVDTPLRGARVLLLEPEPAARQILAQYLLTWGAIATPVSTAEAGIEVMRAAAGRTSRFDVAIVADDASLDAFAFLNSSRADMGGFAATPILIVGSSDEPGFTAEAQSRGFAGFLRKPIHQGALQDALLAALDGRRQPVPDTVVASPSGAVDWNGNPPYVLVAEDNPVNRRLALRQLERLGARCDLVDDGREAVGAVAQARYDLVLMDCQMPEMDGFEATRTIRAQERPGTHVPIIAMTANALEGDRDACLAAGMDDYLAKPVQLAELRATLERYSGGATVAR